MGFRSSLTKIRSIIITLVDCRVRRPSILWRSFPLKRNVSRLLLDTCRRNKLPGRSTISKISTITINLDVDVFSGIKIFLVTCTNRKTNTLEATFEIEHYKIHYEDVIFLETAGQAGKYDSCTSTNCDGRKEI